MNAVEMKNITKVFGSFKANDNINLTVKKNSIHALIGENGAGKSTLMSILFGLYTPTSGEIYINGNPAEINSPLKANMLGIGMVHQHFKLVEDFTVLENIVLNNEDLIANTFLNYSKAKKKIKEIMDKYNFHIDLKKKIYNCSVAEQQRVEILKMLYRDSEILIFDEPTAVLSPEQIDNFLEALLDLKKKGKTIIIITHKLDELKKVADTGTIIRLGKFIANVDIKKITHKELSRLMVGSDIDEVKKTEKENNNNVIFKIDKINVNKKGYKNILGLKDFSMEIKAGEIVGIAGVEGNGQSELINSISGLAPIKSGKMLYRVNDKFNLHFQFQKIKRKIKSSIKHLVSSKNTKITDKEKKLLNDLQSKISESKSVKKIIKKLKISKNNSDEIEENINSFYESYNKLSELLDNKKDIFENNKIIVELFKKLASDYARFVVNIKGSFSYVTLENAKRYKAMTTRHVVEKINDDERWINLNKLSIAAKYSLGIAHIPEDRHLHGLVLDMNLNENGVSQIIEEHPYTQFGLISYKNVKKLANKIISNFDVRSSAGSKSMARSLSGGNQQKFIVGRELTKRSQLILIAQPTRGLDVGAINIIHKYILDAKKQNKAILLISYEIDEIMALADRVIVLNSGENTGILTGKDITREKLGELMARKANNE